MSSRNENKILAIARITVYPWALEVHVEDVDGHVLRFGSEPLPDVPFSEWVETQETPQNRAQWTRPLRTA